MARYTGSVCRLCRREGEKLFFKGSRCYTHKCAIERKKAAPGQHGARRGRFSEYKVQLREKQKIKRMYGLLEKQFRNLFKEADRIKGITGENMLQLLESRLDNMVYRAGFAASRSEARQQIGHGHYLVNGQKVNIPSYHVKPGDQIAVKDKSHKMARVNESMDGLDMRSTPEWLELNKEKYTVNVRALPLRGQLSQPMNEQLVVELYSK